MGLFDKLKKKAQEQIESAGMSDILQNQKDAFRYAMKNGGYSLLGSDAAEKIAAFKEKEEAEKRAKEEAERLRLERIEAERLAKIEAENKAKEEANRLELERIEIERKAKEEADRAIVEEAKRKAAAAAEARAIEEAERLAQIESERRIQEEIDRKAIEDVERRIKAQNDLRALEETERKLKEEEQQRLAEAQKQQDKVLDPIREYVEKAESGDAQAACQIGLWFQHGQKGLPCDKEQAKYWYQQAMVLGNPNAASFLNMLIDEEKKEAGVKAQEEAERIAQEAAERKAQEAAEEVARLKQEEEKRKRLMYNSEDEYLACEKNDGEAALRVGLRLRDEGSDIDETPSIRTLLNNIELLDKSVMYFNIAKVYFPYGKSKEFNISSPDEIERNISLANSSKKYLNIFVESMNAQEVELEKIRREDEMLENRRRREREEEKRKEESMVEVHFEYVGRKNDSSYSQTCHGYKKMPKEEYYSLIQSAPGFLESYVKKNFESYFDYCTDVSMTTK